MKNQKNNKNYQNNSQNHSQNSHNSQNKNCGNKNCGMKKNGYDRYALFYGRERQLYGKARKRAGNPRAGRGRSLKKQIRFPVFRKTDICGIFRRVPQESAFVFRRRFLLKLTAKPALCGLCRLYFQNFKRLTGCFAVLAKP